MGKEQRKTSQGAGVPIPKMKRGVKGFYREVIREMKHVHWPSQKETTRLTGVVLGICGLIITLLWALSQVFSVVINDMILRGGG
jgi:preprotein translocase subunit SecE